MRDFYVKLLGCTVTYENEHACFITYDEEHHRIAFLAMSGLENSRIAASPGLQHFAFTHGSLHELLLAWKERKAIIIEPIRSVNHGPTMSIYYCDPNGNHVETQADVFNTIEEVMKYMATPEYSENPIGVDFDPGDLLARLEADESVKKLTKRPNIGKWAMDGAPLLV